VISNSIGRKKPDPRRRLWGTTATGLRVWLVDGPIVRRDYDIEFTDGGTDQRYKWLPCHEVWIENEGTTQEKKFVLLHELYEHRLMCRGLAYDDAHQQASQRELEARKHPDELAGFLKLEGWS
jgi:hypothetical protein